MSDIDNTTPATEPGTVATPLTVRDIVPISSFEQLPDIHDDDVLVVQDVSVPAYRKLTIRRLLEWLTIGFRQMAFDSAHPAYDPDTGYGDVYVQFPVAYDMETHTIQYNAPEPAQLYNRNGITSTWVELDFDGAFFRANGGFAKTFNSGEQSEGLPNITGAIGGVYGEKTGINGYCSGAFGLHGGKSTKSGFQTAWDTTSGISFYANKSNAIYGASSHVTPTNFTIKVWLRTA